ncbi:hypothetical protein ACFO4E_25830 [Nocardiopsis mangrovi]|uniref:Uncharacterized protein n=1 Tax=Nocardiopsis mangrovi TaxID=1179818 RepID=A0ABV9E2A0_9ACTN
MTGSRRAHREPDDATLAPGDSAQVAGYTVVCVEHTGDAASSGFTWQG